MVAWIFRIAWILRGGLYSYDKPGFLGLSLLFGGSLVL